MYADDQPEVTDPSALDDALLASTFAQRPQIDRAVITEFERKRQRLIEGYVPEEHKEWAEWVKERLLLPTQELAAESAALLQHNPDVCLLKEAERRWWCHNENVHHLSQTFDLMIERASAQTEPAGSFDRADPDSRDAAALVQELLSFHGPLTEAQLRQLLPSAAYRFTQDTDFLIEGALVRHDTDRYLCDLDNFETLLRFQRRASRPTLEPVSIEQWPRWVYGHSSGTPTQVLERLRGYPAPVGVWLNDLVACRVATDERNYQALNDGFNSLDMGWIAAAKDRVTLDFVEELTRTNTQSAKTATTNPIAPRFRDPQARYAFTQLVDNGDSSSESFNTELWTAVWAGQVTSDTLDSLRIGRSANYQLSGHSQSRRARRVSWPGTWSLVHTQPETLDPLEQLEQHKADVRILLERYGVLCREVVNRESPGRWRTLFTALRVMELAGEIVSGAFFRKLSGPQFATPPTLQRFNTTWQEPTTWLSVFDPASLSGLGLTDFGAETSGNIELPHRRQGNHYGLVDGAIVVFSENQGKKLRFLQPPDNAQTIQACAVLVPQLFRLLDQSRLALTHINGEPVRSSPYLAVLAQHTTVQTDHKGVFLETNHQN